MSEILSTPTPTPTSQTTSDYMLNVQEEKGTTIIVTGSRDWTDLGRIFNNLSGVPKKYPPPFLLVHGGAKGADMMANKVAESFGWKIAVVPVTREEWNTLGTKAGPLRNQKMINQYNPNVAFVFRKNNSRGTTDCLNRLKKYQCSSDSLLKEIIVADEN